MHRLSFAVLAVFFTLLFAPLSATAHELRTHALANAQEADARVNLNTASGPELESLPGIGPRMAERIIEYRQEYGEFKKVEDLMNIRGIGEKSFLKLRPLVSVTPTEAKRSGAGS